MKIEKKILILRYLNSYFIENYSFIRVRSKKLYIKETTYFLFRSILVRIPYKITANVAIPGFPTQTLREGYAVMSLRYDWPPKRGTSVGLAIGTPASRESELLRLNSMQTWQE